MAAMITLRRVSMIFFYDSKKSDDKSRYLKFSRKPHIKNNLNSTCSRCAGDVMICALGIGGKCFDSEKTQGTSWTRTTEVDSEVINFNSDGHFSYYYGVGSPVDDYDLYDEYTYDADTQTVTLKSVVDGEDRTIKVVSADDDQLVLIIDMDERTFQKAAD